MVDGTEQGKRNAFPFLRISIKVSYSLTRDAKGGFLFVFVHDAKDVAMLI